MVQILSEGTASKVRIIKEKYDKYFTLVISCFWVFSTLWDIFSFHCYWSDYMLELYSCFFLVFMALNFIIPAKIPKIIINYFGLIKTALGRSITMLVFSLLFLGDEHLLHKLAAICLFIGGFFLLVMEILAPENNEENKFYASNENNISRGNENSQSDPNPPTKLDEENPNGPENLNNNVIKNPPDVNETN